MLVIDKFYIFDIAAVIKSKKVFHLRIEPQFGRRKIAVFFEPAKLFPDTVRLIYINMRVFNAPVYRAGFQPGNMGKHAEQNGILRNIERQTEGHVARALMHPAIKFAVCNIPIHCSTRSWAERPYPDNHSAKAS